MPVKENQCFITNPAALLWDALKTHQGTEDNKTEKSQETLARQVGIKGSRVGVFMASQLTFYLNRKNPVESLNNLGKVSIQSYLHKPEHKASLRALPVAGVDTPFSVFEMS